MHLESASNRLDTHHATWFCLAWQGPEKLHYPHSAGLKSLFFGWRGGNFRGRKGKLEMKRDTEENADGWTALCAFKGLGNNFANQQNAAFGPGSDKKTCTGQSLGQR